MIKFIKKSILVLSLAGLFIGSSVLAVSKGYVFNNSTGTVNIGNYTLPATDGTSGQALITNGVGVATFQSIPAATALPINLLIAATGSNNINNLNFDQIWQWNSLAGGNRGLLIRYAGSTLDPTGTELFVVDSGGSAAAGTTVTNAHFAAHTTGTSIINSAITLEASGGLKNVAAFVGPGLGSVLLGSNYSDLAAGANVVQIGVPTAGTMPLVYYTTQANTTGKILGDDGTGASIVKWITPPAASALPFNGLIDATNTNSLDNTSFLQTWAWNGVTNGAALTMSSNSLTNGTILYLQGSSTVGTSGQVLLKAGIESGTSTGRTTVARFTNAHSSTGINQALQLESSGAPAGSNFGFVSSLNTMFSGLATINPTATLQLGEAGNVATFKYIDGNQAAGKVLVSDASGGATWSSTASALTVPLNKITAATAANTPINSGAFRQDWNWDSLVGGPGIVIGYSGSTMTNNGGLFVVNQTGSSATNATTFAAQIVNATTVSGGTSKDVGLAVSASGAPAGQNYALQLQDGSNGVGFVLTDTDGSGNAHWAPVTASATLNSTQIGYGNTSNLLTGDAEFIRQLTGADYYGTALEDNSTTHNIFMGVPGAPAGITGLTTSLYNIAIGSAAGDALTTGDQNIAIGRDALGVNTTGSRNIGIGYQAGLASAVSMADSILIGDSIGAGHQLGSQGVFIGNGTPVTNNFTGASNVCVGFNVCSSDNGTSSATQVTAVGARAFFASAGNASSAFGYGSGATAGSIGQHSTFLGAASGDDIGGKIGVIAIGFGATVNASNQLTIGGVTEPITDAYIGSGPVHGLSSGSGSSTTINGSGSFGTDQGGGTLSFAGGKGTGAGTGGDLIFKTADALSTGTTLQSLAEAMRITFDTQFVGIGDTTPASLFTVGSGDKFQVNGSGDIVKLNNVTTTFPSSQGGSGTVLTNNGSGTLTWTNPATVGIVTDKVSLTSAEILNLNSTPKQLVVAPGAGFTIQVIAISSRLNFVTTAYLTNVLLQAYETAGSIITQNNSSLIDTATHTRNFDIPTNSYALMDENTALMLTTFGANTTLGDGTLDVYVTYKIITL